MSRKALILVGIAVVVLLLGVSVALQADIPAPSGQAAVGRTAMRWVDASRGEPLTEAQDDHREVVASIWYPAQPGTGARSSYFPGLDAVSEGLRQSGEFSALEVAGLPLIRSQELLDAEVSSAAPSYPVILLSPGGATNVEMYAALAGDLASHGYIVVGLNHPFDVPAVVLSGGSVAVYQPGPFAIEQHQVYIAGRMVERLADILFALDQLHTLDTGLLAGRLDLEHVAVMGHSLGGVAAAQTCTLDVPVEACLNLDGIQRGGPFGMTADPALPTRPFMFLTKEEALSPPLMAMLEALPAPGYLVTVHGAAHDMFADGPLLLPSPLPLPNQADRVLAVTRTYALAFMDETLKGQPGELLTETDSPQVTVAVFGQE